MEGAARARMGLQRGFAAHRRGMWRPLCGAVVIHAALARHTRRGARLLRRRSRALARRPASTAGVHGWSCAEFVPLSLRRCRPPTRPRRGRRGDAAAACVSRRAHACGRPRQRGRAAAHHRSRRNVGWLLVLRRVARADSAFLPHGAVGAPAAHDHLFTFLIDHRVVHSRVTALPLRDLICNSRLPVGRLVVAADIEFGRLVVQCVVPHRQLPAAPNTARTQWTAPLPLLRPRAPCTWRSYPALRPRRVRHSNQLDRLWTSSASR